MAKRPQKVAQKPRGLHKSLLADTWALEISALVLAVCAFVVILVLLVRYNGHPQFQWHGVTLNAVVSVLATVTRIGTVVPVAESLAQWKWMQFSKGPRLLADFDLLDDASRGSRGSFLLLWEKRCWSLTSIGAWIVILSAAIEPFFQQIISFDDAVSYRDNSNVKIAYSTTWNGGSEVAVNPSDTFSSSNGNTTVVHVSGYGYVTDLSLDFQAQAAVLYGLSTSEMNVNQQLSATCPSGNCTWPPYLSLGVCSACNDVTDQVIISRKVDYPMAWYFPGLDSETPGVDPAHLTSYSLPNGINLDNRDPNQDFVDQSDPVLMTARSNLAPSQTVSLKNFTTLLWSTAVLHVDGAFPNYGMWINPSAMNVKATECGVYLCIKEYDTKLENDQLIETSTDISSIRDPDSWQVSFHPDGPSNSYVFVDVSPNVDALYTNTTFFPRTALTITAPSSKTAKNLEKVNATQTGIDALSQYISSIFNDNTFTNATLDISRSFTSPCSLNGTTAPCGHLTNITGMVLERNGNTSSANFVFYPPVMQVLWQSDDLAKTFATLAESITVAMRTAKGSATVSGKLGTLQTLMQVRWAWITLPAMCLAVSAGFLVVSIQESHADATPLWKSGGLAYLAHGLDEKTRERVQHADLASEIEEASEGIEVRLERGEDGVLMLRGAPEKVISDDHMESEEHEMVPLSAGADGRGDA